MKRNKAPYFLVTILAISLLTAGCAPKEKSKELSESAPSKSGDEIYREQVGDAAAAGSGEDSDAEAETLGGVDEGAQSEDEVLGEDIASSYSEENSYGQDIDEAYTQDMDILGDLELEEGEALIPETGKDIPFQGRGPGDETPDWDSLKLENPEIVAWIVVPGTDISMPVLQRMGNQTYYDDHDESGRGSSYGALHLDTGNLTGFDDPNTIIYGCDTYGSSRDRGPFAPLKAYKDLSFMEKNRYIYVYTPVGAYEFCIFAAYSGSETDILSKVNGFDFYVFTDYINGIYDDNSPDAVTDPALQAAAINGWRLLTLSAGPTTDSTDRFFVQATFSGSTTY